MLEYSDAVQLKSLDASLLKRPILFCSLNIGMFCYLLLQLRCSLINFFLSKKIWVGNCFGSKKIWVGKKFGSKKDWVTKNLGNKIWVGNLLVLKKIESEIWDGQIFFWLKKIGSEFFWG